jgi:hypothetical protein
LFKTQYNFLYLKLVFFNAPSSDGTTVKVPFMTMSVGIVSPSMQSFSDIREITELAAEARRQDTAAGG